MIIERLPIGGISYDLVFHDSNGWSNHQMVGALTKDEWWKGFLLPASFYLSYNGLIYWSYALGALLSIAIILVMPAKGPPVTDMICWSLVAQLILIIFFVFNPSANYL